MESASRADAHGGIIVAGRGDNGLRAKHTE